MTLTRLKLLCIAMSLGLATFSHAFQEDKPAGAKPYSEQSMEQLKAQQSLQGTIGVVGSVPGGQAPIQPKASLGERDNGSFSSAEAVKAKSSFNVASKTIKEVQSQMSPLFLLLIMVGVAVLAAVGIKAYSDKAVPLPSRLRT